MSAIILRRMLGEKVWAGGDPVLELMMREVQETDEPEKQASLCRRFVQGSLLISKMEFFIKADI